MKRSASSLKWRLQLAVDDPKLVSTLSGKVRSPKKNRMFAGILLFFTGLATLLAGLISQAIPVGIAGFVLDVDWTRFHHL